MTDYQIVNIGRRLGQGPIMVGLKVGKNAQLQFIPLTDARAYSFALDILKAIRIREDSQGG